ncbi:hypothetical protein ADUPG1_012019, partial [Aduncisulcus paluster]
MQVTSHVDPDSSSPPVSHAHHSDFSIINMNSHQSMPSISGSICDDGIESSQSHEEAPHYFRSLPSGPIEDSSSTLALSKMPSLPQFPLDHQRFPKQMSRVQSHGSLHTSSQSRYPSSQQYLSEVSPSFNQTFPSRRLPPTGSLKSHPNNQEIPSDMMHRIPSDQIFPFPSTEEPSDQVSYFPSFSSTAPIKLPSHSSVYGSSPSKSSSPIIPPSGSSHQYPFASSPSPIPPSSQVPHSTQSFPVHPHGIVTQSSLTSSASSSASLSMPPLSASHGSALHPMLSSCGQPKSHSARISPPSPMDQHQPPHVVMPMQHPSYSSMTAPIPRRFQQPSQLPHQSPHYS